MLSAGGALLQLKQILNSIGFSVIVEFLFGFYAVSFFFLVLKYYRALSHVLYSLIFFVSVFMLGSLFEICINFITVVFVLNIITGSQKKLSVCSYFPWNCNAVTDNTFFDKTVLKNHGNKWKHIYNLRRNKEWVFCNLRIIWSLSKNASVWKTRTCNNKKS